MQQPVGRKTRKNESDSEAEAGYFSDCGTTLVYTRNVFKSGKKRGRPRIPSPTPTKRQHTAPLIDLAGEEFCSAEIDLSDFRLSAEQKEELLACPTAQRLCWNFFESFGMTVTPQIRTDGKHRFCRLSINRGEYTFEESLDSSLLGRVVASLKAVRAFNPELVSTWLRKNKKVHALTKGCLI